MIAHPDPPMNANAAIISGKTIATIILKMNRTVVNKKCSHGFDFRFTRIKWKIYNLHGA